MRTFTLTRKNLRAVLNTTGHTRENLIKLFGIKDDDRRMLNRLDQTIEAERKSGFLEIGPDGKYRQVSNINEPINNESVLSVS